MTAAQDGLANLLKAQSVWCTRLGSPLYAGLLENASEDCARGGPVWKVLEGHENDPISSALSLRFMGSVYRLVLEGKAPELELFYRRADSAEAWPAFRAVVERHLDELGMLIERPVQTNEAGRSCSLLGGFLVIARETRIPLSLREIGSCAGFLLRWDRYRYEGGSGAWGPAGSEVRFVRPFVAAEPDLATPVTVVDRAGCDPNPIDPATEEGRLALASFVWPDQRERLSRLDGACSVAARVPALVERADALSWLRTRLSGREFGVATVVFHSITWQYLSSDDRAAITGVIVGEGSHAARDRPLAWLRFEPKYVETGAGPFQITLTLWPDGEERVIASSHAHGPPVDWLG